MKVRVNLKIVPIEKVRANPWNPNKQSDFIFEKERESIREHGFIDPILVRGKGPGYEVIDGEHRLKAAIAEGFKEIPVNDLGKVSDDIAKKLTIITNETRGKSDPTLLQTLLKELEKDVGIEDLIKSLPMQQVEIEAMLANASVDWNEIGPSLGAPVVVGGEMAPPMATSDKTGKDQSLPSAFVIEVVVNKKVYGDFFEQMDRFKKAIGPKASNIDAIQAMIVVMRQSDLKSVSSKGFKVLLRRSNKSKTKK